MKCPRRAALLAVWLWIFYCEAQLYIWFHPLDYWFGWPVVIFAAIGLIRILWWALRRKQASAVKIQ